MNLFRTLSFLLAVSLAANSCSPAVKSWSQAPDLTDSLSVFRPLGAGGERKLFRAGIDVPGRHFSGLVLVKPMPAPDSYRVLFLSELGLNLLDMAYEKGEFTVISVQEFLNRKWLLKSLQKDFHALLLDLSRVRDPDLSWYQSDGMHTGILRFRQGFQGYRYVYEEDSGRLLIRIKKGCIGSSEIRVEREGELRISISHRGNSVHIDMTELKQSKENPDGRPV